MVHKVGDKLRVGLGLVPASHDPESNPDVSSAHHGRDNGVQWPLVSREGVRVGGVQAEQAAAILKDESGPLTIETGAA